uniref:Bestrophin homolog n=1 Tax=Acrobeloides nanus TaxID=290746 RepID=A0A914C245_9BILA
MVLYKYAFSTGLQLSFAKFANFIDGRLGYINLVFILGFFVTTVVDRWKTVFNNIGFIDNVAFHMASYIRGDDKETTTVRRNCMRYLCLTQVLVLRDIALSVRKRFPNYDSLVEAGFLMEHERKMLEEERSTFQKYWMPINWVFNLCYEMRAKDKVIGDVLLNGLLLEVKNYRDSLQQLFNTDAVPIPLVYPQVVFVATRVYFFLCIFSRQYIINAGEKNRDVIDEWVPFMTMLQLVFSMGWLKVAEALMNPLGLDDDDFECNYIIDRNVAISTLMADKHWGEYPVQMRDQIDPYQFQLYSEQSALSPLHKLIGSAALVTLVEQNMRVNMVPHNGYTPLTPKPRSRSRGFSTISNFVNPLRKATNSFLHSDSKNDDTITKIDNRYANKSDDKVPDFVEIPVGSIPERNNIKHRETISTVDEEVTRPSYNSNSLHP